MISDTAAKAHTAYMSLRERVAKTQCSRYMRNFYRGFVRPGDLVLDIGANIGDYTEAFLSLGARVIAVEPDPDALVELRRRFARNNRVTILEMGVADRRGRQQLYVSSGGSPLTTMAPDWIAAMRASGTFSHIQWHPQHEVTVTTLDALVAQHGVPTFCKIDVEGFELPVVRGLSRPLRVISLEFQPEYLEQTNQALDRLDSLGAVQFACAVGRSFRFAGRSGPGKLGEWTGAGKVKEQLAQVPIGGFGDVYARYSEHSGSRR